ncbi:MAG: hypothetical protein AB7D47_12430 [Desulfovibrio sp.]
MAYNSEQMRLMGGVPGQQLFLYRSDDERSEITASGYFDPAVEHYNLSSGDIVLCVSGADSAPALGALVATVAQGTAGMLALS